MAQTEIRGDQGGLGTLCGVRILGLGPGAPRSDSACCSEGRALGEAQSWMRQIEPGPTGPGLSRPLDLLRFLPESGR